MPLIFIALLPVTLLLHCRGWNFVSENGAEAVGLGLGWSEPVPQLPTFNPQPLPDVLLLMLIVEPRTQTRFQHWDK